MILYNPPAVASRHQYEHQLSLAGMILAGTNDVRIIDGFPREAMARLGRARAEGVWGGISAMTGDQIRHGLVVSQHMQNLGMHVKWGGAHATLLPDQTRKHRLVDEVAGAAADPLPVIDYAAADLESHFAEIGRREVPYFVTRGCPNRCGFCCIDSLGLGKWHAKPIGRVIAELRALVRDYGVTTIKLVDDNLLAYPRYSRKLFEAIHRAELHLTWLNVNGSADALLRHDDDTLRLMRDCGVASVLIGVESAYGPALKLINKPATHAVSLLAMTRLRRCGIGVQASMMLGFPFLRDRRAHEAGEVVSTLRFLAWFYSTSRSRHDYVHMFAYTPYPGTPLTDQCRELGWVQPDTLEGWGGHTLSNTVPPWSSFGMGVWIRVLRKACAVLGATNRGIRR